MLLPNTFFEKIQVEVALGLLPLTKCFNSSGQFSSFHDSHVGTKHQEYIEFYNWRIHFIVSQGV